MAQQRVVLIYRFRSIFSRSMIDNRLKSIEIANFRSQNTIRPALTEIEYFRFSSIRFFLIQSIVADLILSPEIDSDKRFDPTKID